MISNAELPVNLRNAMAIIQNAGDENGWMSEEEYTRTQAELRKLGLNVVTTINGDESEDESPATDEDGRTFFEVSIHPFVEQVADENGEAMNGFGFNPGDNDLDAYPDAMFRKGWSVTSWVQAPDDEYDHDDDGEYEGDIDAVDDEEFPDYDTAIARAEELAALYRVEIDHRY